METLDEKIEQLQTIIDESHKIVFFGGAGVSTESGIPDFRSVDGLYNQKWQFPPEVILSHSFFYKNTEEFFRFYNEKLLIEGIKPNKAHLKLAELEQKGKLSAIITQNIDGLHQQAGSKTVYELHGSVLRNYCTKCGKFYDSSFIADFCNNGVQNKTSLVPKCTECNSLIKPDVVLYEEGLDNTVIDNATQALYEADCLIIGGTSLVVYPAASLINYFKGKNLVLINKGYTAANDRANLVIQDKIGEVLGRIRV